MTFTILNSIELLTKHRIIIIRLLLIPSLIIFFGGKYFKNELDKLYNYLPKPVWLIDAFQISNTILYLFACVGLAIILISLFWLLVLFLIKQVINLEIEERTYLQSINYGLSILLECSFWWSTMYMIQILYKLKTPTDFLNLEELLILKLPTIFFIIMFVSAWMTGKTNFNTVRQVKQRSEE